MIIGSDSGKVFFYRNEKGNLQGNWKTIANYGKNLKFPRGSSPVAYDLDNDGDLDLISGSDNGYVVLFRNDAIIRESTSTTEFQEITDEQ